MATEGIDPNDLRIRRDLYFPYTEEEVAIRAVRRMEAVNPCVEVPVPPELEGLRKMAYTHEGMQEVIRLVWALPGGFWKAVCQRLIATTIVGKQ